MSETIRIELVDDTPHNATKQPEAERAGQTPKSSPPPVPQFPPQPPSRPVPFSPPPTPAPLPQKSLGIVEAFTGLGKMSERLAEQYWERWQKHGDPLRAVDILHAGKSGLPKEERTVMQALEQGIIQSAKDIFHIFQNGGTLPKDMQSRLPTAAAQPVVPFQPPTGKKTQLAPPESQEDLFTWEEPKPAPSRKRLDEAARPIRTDFPAETQVSFPVPLPVAVTNWPAQTPTPTPTPTPNSTPTPSPGPGPGPGPNPNPPPPQPPSKAQQRQRTPWEQAQFDMDREAQERDRQRAYDTARKRIDPGYASRMGGRDSLMASNALAYLGVGGTGGKVANLALNVAGSMGTDLSGIYAAATGPVGQLAMAAAMAGRAIKESLMASINKVGDQFATIASLDPAAAFGQFNQSLKSFSFDMFGLVRPFETIGTINDQLVKFGNALDSSASRLRRYEGSLASAEAQAKAAQIYGDIGRANRLGPELSEWVKARSQLSQAGQDLLAELVRPLIPVLTRFIQGVARTLEVITAVVTKIGDGFQVMMEKLEQWMAKLFDLLAQMVPAVALIAKIVERIRSKNDKAPRFSVEDIFGMGGNLHNLQKQAQMGPEENRMHRGLQWVPPPAAFAP